MSDASYADMYRDVNFREYPEKYVVGRGEQGVLIAEPYKSEILPHWKFKDEQAAKTSAETIYAMFETYKKNDDFVGMDMARKFLQMGFTRARRYANHKGGKKYDGPVPADKKGQSGAHGRALLDRTPEDPVKAAAAKVFFGYYQKVKDDAEYLRMKQDHQAHQP